MNKYRIKLDIEVEVEAFNQEDATEYIYDISIFLAPYHSLFGVPNYGSVGLP